MTLGPLDAFGGSANLARLSWRGWGRPVATARGIERGFRYPLVRVRVRVRVSRLREDCNGDQVYTRLRITSRHGSLLVRYPTCFDEQKRHDGHRSTRSRHIETRDPDRSL
jgi:hypothetical protein